MSPSQGSPPGAVPGAKAEAGKSTEALNRRDDRFFADLTRTNNEFANLHRELARTNAELGVARDRAEAADRVKSAFLASMSHELRTPLNSIIGFTSILLQGLSGPLNPEQQQQLRIVQNSGRHLLALINDVLDVSKIEAGELRVGSERFDLGASIRSAVDAVAPLAQAKGLALEVTVAPMVGEVRSDRRRVEQVLLNMLGNAVKFTERGTVSLRAEVADSAGPAPMVRLTVSDTGIGIKAEDLASLFQPFRQLDSGRARNSEGTGLGLAICRKLAGLLGGELHVESEWGRGSAFTFALPIGGTMPDANSVALPVGETARDAASVALPVGRLMPDANSVRGAPVEPASPMKVLLIEGDDGNRSLATFLLEKDGHCVTQAFDGAAALELAARERFDLILLELQLPGMDGYAVARAIRADPALSSVPVVAVTSHAMAGEREKVRAAGCQDYLEKPIDPESFVADVSRHVHRNEHRGEP